MSRPARPSSAPAKLLLVDDDADLRFVTQALLEMDGHQVVSCGDPMEALATFREAGSMHSLDLLLTDLQMPYLSGIELAQEISLVCPALPVLLISGSVLTSEARHTVATRGWRFLSKPFHVPELLSHVRSLLLETTQLRAAAERVAQ